MPVSERMWGFKSPLAHKVMLQIFWDKRPSRLEDDSPSAQH